MNLEITIIFALAISYVHSHAILINPISRGSIWRLIGPAHWRLAGIPFGVIV